MLGSCWEVTYNCHPHEVVVCFKVGEANLVKARVRTQSRGAYAYRIQRPESDVECPRSGHRRRDGLGRWWACVCHRVSISGAGDSAICGIWGIAKARMLRPEGKKRKRRKDKKITVQEDMGPITDLYIGGNID